MLIGVKLQVTHVLTELPVAGGLHHTMRAGEFRHNEAAATLGADQAPEYGICDARHGRQNRCGAQVDRSNTEFGRKLWHSYILTGPKASIETSG